MTLARTPLHDWHVAHGGRMVDFAGWRMPVQYTSIVAEHTATRTGVGLFDISHMGRLRFDGPGAGRFLDGLVTRRVADLAPGRIRYALVTNHAGGILDDVLVYHLADAAGESYWMLVVNAGNREKILAWLAPFLVDAADVQFSDATHDWAMIAVQGPGALELVDPLVDAQLPAMKYYQGREARIDGRGGIVSRTGYTGEDGFELIVGAPAAVAMWEKLLAAGSSTPGLDSRTVPAGLGSRDTLRLEAAMPLYGHELNEQVNPFQAGLSFAVDLENREFPGRDALAKLQDAPQDRLVGLQLRGKRVPREDYPVFHERRQVGRITSGTFSPTLKRPIAMAYVQPASAAVGTELTIDIRGRHEQAWVVQMPFYRRKA